MQREKVFTAVISIAYGAAFFGLALLAAASIAATVAVLAQ